MVAILRSAVIDAPLESVWRVLRDFNSHELWHPQVAVSEIEEGLPVDQAGCVRRFRLRDGTELREQLIALSDRDFSFTYCILDSPIPLIDYVATVRLRPVTDSGRTFWEWRSSFRTPPGQEDALAGMVAHDIYDGGFKGLQQFLDRGGPTRSGSASAAGAAVRPGANAIEAEAIVLHQYGGPEVLLAEVVRVPPPGPGEVRLRQTAIGVNYLDVYVRSGENSLLLLPATPGAEAAGEVMEVGAGVTHLLPGDRVAYACLPLGSYAALRTMKADHVVALPQAIDDEVAAAVMLKGLTAEYLLRRTHRVERGDILLVHAAAGGVGLLLCQWAKHLGATVMGTVSTVDKARLARAAGCDYPIVGAMDEFAGRVMEITRGHGADVIYDGIGKASFAGSFEALALRGHLVLYGQATGIPDPISHTMLAEKSATVTRPVLFHYTAEPESLTDMARNLFGMIESGTLKVSINQRFTLRDAAQAHRELEGRRTTGSTILLP
jgi:NADPH:quinone reductase-like Zn-dependent oxidoreductase